MLTPEDKIKLKALALTDQLYVEEVIRDSFRHLVYCKVRKAMEEVKEEAIREYQIVIARNMDNMRLN